MNRFPSFASVFIALLSMAHLGNASTPSASALEEAFAEDNLPLLDQYIRQLQNQPCPDTSLLLAKTLHAYAAWYLIPENAWEAADSLLREALAIRKNNLAPDDTDIGRTAYNLGLVKLELGDYEEAILCFQLTEKLFTLAENWKVQIMARRMFAVVLEAKGDHDRVQEELRFCVDLAREKNLIKEEADVLLDWGMNCNLRGAYDEGILRLEEALDRYQQMDREQVDYNPVNKGFCYINFANAYSDQGNYEKALNACHLALEFIDPEDHPNRCKVYNNIGFNELQLNHYAKALEALEKGGEIAKGLENPIYLARIWDNKGDLLKLKKDFPAAVALYSKSIEALLPPATTQAITAERLKEAIYKDELLIFLTDRAACQREIFAQTGDKMALQAAMADYHWSDQVIDLMRYEQTAQGSKLHWRSITRPVYEAALAVCYELQNKEEAFYFLEKSKSVLLLDAFSAAQARTLIPTDLAEKEMKLKRKLSNAQLAVLTNSGEEQKKYMDLVVQKRAELDELADYLQEAFPEYWASRYTGQTISLSELQQEFLEKEKGSLVSFLLGDAYLYRWSMRYDGKTLLTRLPRKEVDGWLIPYLEHLSLLRTSFRPADYAALAFPLFQHLVGTDFAQSERLYVVPDGQLGFIPFEALMKSPEYSLDQYLVFDYPIQAVYSASVLNKQKEGLDGGHLMTSFAPIFSEGNRNLPPLENSEVLLDALPKVRQEQFVHDAATLANFQQWSKESQIINLITHAEAGEDELPRIEFWDSTLYLPQLYAMEIPADLVILAACETGIGSLTNGEGIMSLSQGMTYAGAASLIASLWKVRESSTTNILSSFYEHVQEGQSKVNALHQAKLGYLASCKETELNPYFWASLVYYGADGFVLNQQADFLSLPIWGFLLGGGLLVSLCIWGLTRSKRFSAPMNETNHGLNQRSNHHSARSLELAEKRNA